MKKFIPYILIIAIVGVGVLGPIGAKNAHAWDIFGIGDIAYTVLVKIVASVGNIILWLASRVLWLTSHLFDYTLELTVENNTFSSITAVNEGWKASRDIVNMFFIFILLYIAIATILQISGYGIKDLLVKVIIIALLVNFSLMITKVIIDASNILALEFYDQIQIKNPTTGEIQKREITQVMMQGLKLQTIYEVKELKAPDEPEGSNNIMNLSTVIVGTLFGSILILVTAFVFFAATILFILRTIALLFLMILAPLAFLAMVLPKTQQYASEWWGKLFKWSFFAPAFMFMIYIVAKIIASNDFQAILGKIGANSDAMMSAALTGKEEPAIGVLVNYILLIGLMIGSLIVAQRMGAVGSGAVMKWGKQLKGAAQGYAGKISKRGAGYVAEKAIDEKSWINRKTGGRFAKSLNLMPGATRGLARVSSWREKQLKERDKKREKLYGSYSDAGLAAMTKREKFGATEIGLETVGQGPRITEGKKKVIEKILLDRTINQERGKTEKEREIDFEGGKMKLGEAEKLILSLKREVVARGDNAEVAQKRLTELVLRTARTKKKHKDEYGGEEGLTEKKVKEMINESSKGGGPTPSPEKTT